MNDDLTGVWFGESRCSHGVNTQNFMLNIDDAGMHFDGRMDEPEYLGEYNVERQIAPIEGIRTGKLVFFTKNQDGSGTGPGTVKYNGRLRLGGNCVEGVWEIEGMRGSFTMTRPIIANDYIEAETNLLRDG
jgi:hypothetical protein